MITHTQHICMRVGGFTRNTPQFRFTRGNRICFVRRVPKWHDVTDDTCQRIVKVVNEWQERGLGVIEAEETGWIFSRRQEGAI